MTARQIPSAKGPNAKEITILMSLLRFEISLGFGVWDLECLFP